jgi:LysR family hca operon transcriptional activator
MELRHMRYFVAVAEERNFTRAAARLHLAQPSLSRQIRDLESELGVSLLDRGKGGITLTAAGNEYLAQVRKDCLRIQPRRSKSRKRSAARNTDNS